MDTDNGCGWCLYGGLCSGTPDPCPTPPGVNNSYLMVYSHIVSCAGIYISFAHLFLAFLSLAAVLGLMRCVLF